MPKIRKLGQLAAVGSTGNNTHASVSVDGDADSLSVEVEVTVAGATPTFTYKVQGSMDEPVVTDANSDWFDLEMLPAGAVAEVATDTKTAVGVYEYEIDLHKRPIRKARLVTSANTNITYEGELWGALLDQ